MTKSTSLDSNLFSRRALAGCLATDGRGYDSDSALFFEATPFLGLNPTMQHGKCPRELGGVSA